MRCSPDGRWLVVCYELACLVYDVKGMFVQDNFIQWLMMSRFPFFRTTLVTKLTQEDVQQSAEHAEWSPTGEYLLTRTKKELRLWKAPSSDEENKVCSSTAGQTR